MSAEWQVRLADGTGFGVRPGETVLAAGLRAHWLMRHGCRNGNCEACAATLIKGRVNQSGRLLEADAGPRPLLLCAARPESDLEIALNGNPLAGSSEQARRSYARVDAVQRLDDGCWQLRLTLPPGRSPPVRAGQYLLLETVPPLPARLGADALHGRELAAVTGTEPPLAPGSQVHMRYPLGYGYRTAPPSQPLWLLHEPDAAAQAVSLGSALGADRLLAMTSTGHQQWPPSPVPVAIHALAADEAVVRRWYAGLLAAGVAFTALRSDFCVLRPWQVCRQDDNGNRFVMMQSLDEPAARAQAEVYAARGHKQLYWAEPVPDI